MPDVAKERVSPPTYSFIYGQQLWVGGNFLICDKFIHEDAEYSHLSLTKSNENQVPQKALALPLVID